jgi:hypothetical protein
MVGLPRPELLLLSEAIRFVVKLCGCSEADAKHALRDAGLNGRLIAKGAVPRSAHPNIRKAAAHPYRADENLRPGDWANEIDWASNRIGRCLGVRITLASIEAWLNCRPDVETSNTMATPEMVADSIGPSTTANNTPKASPFRDNIEAEYKKRQCDSQKEKGRGTTVGEDEAWRRSKGITRQRMRELRRTNSSPESQKGGAPRKHARQTDE